jgi:hypothetical protein
MRSIIVSAGLLTASFVAYAQQPNTVSATVSTTQPVTAGSAVFRVQFLDANPNSTLDTALGVLGGAGAASSNLSEVSVQLNQNFVVTQYDFVITKPAGEFAATRDQLIAAQRAIANVSSQLIGWSVSYTSSDEDAAKALEQAMPNLLSQARQQATVLAAAMEKALGRVSSISTPAVTRSGLNLTVAATVTYLVE